MRDMSFERMETMLKELNQTMKQTMDDTMLERMTSEERLNRIDEIDEALIVMHNMMQNLIIQKEEIKKAEEEYQAQKHERINMINKITNMFGFKKKEPNKVDNIDAMVSDAQIEYTLKENELKQLSYDISGKINTLRTKINRTDLEEYELTSLISQLSQINDILNN